LLYTAYAAICHALLSGPDAAQRCLASVASEAATAPAWLQGVLALPRCTAFGWEMRMGEAAELAAAALGSLSEAPETLDDALAPLRALAHFYRLAGAVYRQGEAPEPWVQACVAEARRAGLADLESIGLAQRVGAAGLAGGWPALQSAQVAFDRSRERAALSQSLAGEALARRAVAALHHGDWHAGLALEATFPPFLAGTFYEVWIFSPLIACACLVGEVAHARALLERLEAAGSSPWYGLLLARAFVAVWDGWPNAEALIADVLHEEGPGPRWQPAHEAWAWRLRAEWLARRGDEAGVAAALNEATRCGASFPLQAAITLYWRARLATDARTREGYLQAAADAFATLEAAPWLVQVERLRHAGEWIIAEGGALKNGGGIPATERCLTGLLREAMDCAQADRGRLLLVDDGERVRTASVFTLPGVGESAAYSHTVVRHVLTSRRAVWVTDAGADPRLLGGLSLEALAIPSLVCVPLVWDDRLEGLFYLERLQARAAFDSEKLAHLEALAAHGALALAYRRTATESGSLRESRARALEAAAEREVVLGQVVHDLRNAVHAIGLMQAELQPWAKREASAEPAVSGIGGQVEFLQRFLQAKLEQLLVREQGRTRAALADTFAALRARFAPLAENRGLTLRVAEAPAVYVALEAVELQQMLGNLLENAL
jgi:signal transduction histidine kinase